jgi:hypothetical protein
MDTLQRDVAHEFGLTNLKLGRDDGKIVIQNLRSETDFSPRWVDTPRPAPGWSSRGETPAALPVASMGMQAGNALSSMATPKQIPTNIVGKYSGE